MSSKTEKRNQHDRRRRPTPPLSRYTFVGRRRKNRRQGEQVNYYVDRFEPKYYLVVATVIILSITDALFTLVFLQHGGTELNPIMDLLIRKDPLLFMSVKFLLTAVCVFILLIHKNFVILGKIPLRYFLYLVFFLYFLLILYEIGLYFQHVAPV